MAPPRVHQRLSAFLSALVVLIFATVKFKEGAWVVVIVGPIMFFGLIRLHRQYMVEDEQLEEGACEAAEAPVLSRHEVVVLVDRLDMATARALQYARTLHPDDAPCHPLRPRPAGLGSSWRRSGDGSACPTSPSTSRSARTVGSPGPHSSWPPRRWPTARPSSPSSCPGASSPRGWQRVLHDNTAEHIATAVGHLEHVNATVVPYQLEGGWWSNRREWRRKADGGARRRRHGQRAADKARRPGPWRPGRCPTGEAFGERARGTIPIGDAQWRQRVRVAGRVRSVRVQPRAGTSNLECLLADDSGMLLLVFQGRRRIPGIQPGARLVVEGMVGDWARRQAILNPDYELIAGPEAAASPSDGPVGSDDSCPWTPLSLCSPRLPGTRRAPRRAPALGRPAVTSRGGTLVPRRPRRDAPLGRVAIDRNRAVHRREPHR